MAKLVSIQIGLPKSLPAEPQFPLASKPWVTGFHKSPVENEVQVTTTGISGDGQADLKNHGGLDKALCVYPSEHFCDWAEFLDINTFPPGGFGENLTVVGLLESDVCIGDTYRIGELLIQVSQPRQPCWKLARRWNCKALTPEVQSTGKTGWYFRVLEPGKISAGMEIQLVTKAIRDDANSGWTIQIANRIIYDPNADTASVEALASFEPLSESWKSQLSQKLGKV